MPSAFLIVSGNGQTGTVGQPLSSALVAKAVDAAGSPVPGQTITFTVISGGGAVAALSAVTNDSGRAQTTWTLGTSTADSQKVAAGATSPTTGAPVVFGVFVATPVAGAPLAAQRVSSDSQVADPGQPLAESLAVKLVDQYGNPVGGSAVTWSVPPVGGGTLSPALAQTDAGGIARTRWTAGNLAGVFTATATSGAASASFHANVQPVIASLSVGASQACAVSSTGASWCWGQGSDGRLGDTAPDTCQAPNDCSRRPLRVQANGVVFSLVTAGVVSCATDTGHVPYCWGLHSAVGDGSASATPQPAPVQIAGALHLGVMSAGPGTVCSVTSTGSGIPWCWGDNSSGQLGIGTVGGSVNTPQAVSGGVALGTVATGAFHVCGLALGPSSFCWGSNAFGQLGSDTATTEACGGATCRSTPAKVRTSLQFSSLSSGDDVTCGLTNGTAWCWGRDFGWTTGPSSTCSAGPCIPVPQQLNGSISFAQVDLGTDHACGVTAAGAAYCWGDNANGKLGTGTPGTPSTTPVAVSGGLVFASVSAGRYSTCGLTTAGRVYCWGQNLNGLLGTGTAALNSPVPVRVVF